MAGSTVAALLGDAGYSVLLVDRATFPSSTCSTHFFRGAGMVAVLDRLGVLDEVLALDAPPLVREYTYERGEAQPLVGPPQDPGEAGFCLSVRRERLDQILVRRARKPSTVRLLERTRLADVLRNGERVAGVRLATPDGERTVLSQIVIGADGRHSAVARAVGPAFEENVEPCRALYYRYVRGFSSPDGGEPDGPEFSLLGDEMAYVFPSDGGVTCIAISVNLDVFAWLRKAFDQRFDERLAMHRGLAPRVAATERVSRLLGCGPERSYVRVPGGPGWAMVGDAGMHQDPWTGLGIDMASVHASFLAEALIAWFDGRTSESEALAAYHDRRDEHGLERWRRTVVLAQDLRKAESD